MSKYTQRQWDRIVGWGSVPDEYKEEEMKPNTQFELSVKDLDIIEHCLRYKMPFVDEEEKTKITQLLGKIHNQKNWHRPRNDIYVSG